MDEPGSTQYNYQIWRQQRNEQTDNETRSQAEVACMSCFLHVTLHGLLTLHPAADRRWDRTVATFVGPAFPLNMAFHSYDQHLVVSNDTDIISLVLFSKFFLAHRQICLLQGLGLDSQETLTIIPQR